MAYDAADFTDEWYEGLPELYRVADAAEPSGGGTPLLRFLDLLGAQADEVETIADDVRTGRLTDPATADAAWLPWLAQLVGIRLPTGGTTDGWREVISAGAAGWQRGTIASIQSAVRAVLVDDGDPPYAEAYADSAVPWTIYVRIISTQAPSPPELIVDAIVAAGAKPAGFKIELVYDAPTWGEMGTLVTHGAIDALGPSWGGVDAGP